MVRTLWVSAVLLQISGKAVSSVGNRPSNPEYHRCFLPLLFNSQEPGANPLSPHKNGFIHSSYWKKKSFKHCSLHFKIFILIPESLRGKTLEPTTSCVWKLQVRNSVFLKSFLHSADHRIDTQMFLLNKGIISDINKDISSYLLTTLNYFRVSLVVLKSQ